MQVALPHAPNLPFVVKHPSGIEAGCDGFRTEYVDLAMFATGATFVLIVNPIAPKNLQGGCAHIFVGEGGAPNDCVGIRGGTIGEAKTCLGICTWLNASFDANSPPVIRSVAPTST